MSCPGYCVFSTIETLTKTEVGAKDWGTAVIVSDNAFVRKNVDFKSLGSKSNRTL